MKTIKFFAFSLLISTSASALPIVQDSLGLPGDNLDLYGVLELFKKSENPEEFEKALNKEDSKLNNLDLNGDNKTDYIHVIDRKNNDAHALVLQVAVNETESQDVAVIEIEKKADGSADIQVVGDEDLYGKNYIIEPADENTVKAAESSPAKSNTTVIVNVWHWPAVQYMYRPSYVVWISPWGWSHYPVWWSPWRPVYWYAYHPHWKHYHSYHRRVYAPRLVTVHNYYYGHRQVSKTVYQKRAPAPAHRTARPTDRTAKPIDRTPQKVRKEQAPRKQQVKPKNQGRQKQPSQKGGKRK
jgi:hypothetical protein